MIYVLSGGTKLFAAIGVTYPAGSTLTCTNGTKTLKAKTTTGQWVFAVPEAGTWTVTATNGGNSKSKSVSITTEGQFEEVALSYELVLFDNSVASGWAKMVGSANGSENLCTASISNGKIVMSGADVVTDLLFYKNTAVSTVGYTNAKITVDSVNAGTYGNPSRLVLQSTPAAGGILGAATAAAEISITAPGTFTLKLPSGDYYVGIIARGGQITASKIWFE